MIIQLPSEFFTRGSMATLAGAAGMTAVICNTLQSALNFNPKWLALVVAQIISVLGAYYSGQHDYVVAVVNGLLIFSTASGGTSVAGAALNAKGSGTRGMRRDEPVKRGFLAPWF